MGTILAVILGRIAFGYQVQTVASLGPNLIGAFSIDLATLGTLMALYLLPAPCRRCCTVSWPASSATGT